MNLESKPQNSVERLTISIVIPTHNRASSLKATLNALHALLVPDGAALQVVIVMDGCTDNSEDVIGLWQTGFKHSVETICTDGVGAGGARNAGIKLAIGDLVGFIDDDVIPSPSWLEEHLKSHTRATDPLVSIGAMTLPADMRLPPWNEWEVKSLNGRYSELESGSARAGPADLYTANAMMPRSALEKVGGFDTSLSRAEDVDLGLKLEAVGLKFQFLTDAKVAHYPIRTLENWKNIPVAYAHSHFKMQHGSLERNSVQLGSPQLSKMNPMTKLAVRLFANYKISSTVYCFIAQALGSMAYRLRLQSVSYAAFSSVYNVLYFGTLYRVQEKHLRHER